MKASIIQVGNLYEVKSGHNVTVVKVKAINEKTGGWTCETSKGKVMNVADPKRFVKEVTPKKKAVAEKTATDKKKSAGKKPTLKEFIESKSIKVIPKGRRATSSMRDLDDPTFTRKHHAKTAFWSLRPTASNRSTSVRSRSERCLPSLRPTGFCLKPDDR